MSADRILGSSASLSVYNATNGLVPVGELDSFTSEDEHELKKFHPLGQVEEHGQLIYKGYKLSFQGAKINGDVEAISTAIDTALLAGKASPRYKITETTTFLDGTVETFTYDNALIYNFKVDKSNAEDEIKEEFSGWAPKKAKG